MRFAVAAVFALAACGSAVDGAPDAGQVDAADTGVIEDAALPDAIAPDAGEPDAIAPDADAAEDSGMFAAPAIATVSLPYAINGVAYSAPIAITGGAPPLAISTTSLPSGLALDTSMPAITGVPSAAPGSYPVQITVVDALARVARQTLPLVILAPLEITTATLPDGVTGEAYSATLAASGGLAPYAWRVASGALPAGVALTGDRIEGIAAAPGSSTFTVEVSDALGGVVSATFTMRVVTPLRIATLALPDALAGVSYAGPIRAEEGTPPYTWRLDAAPSTLAIVGNGPAEIVLSGVPTTSGTFEVRVSVTDADGSVVSATYALEVINDLSLDSGSWSVDVLEPFSASVAAHGGLGTYTFALASGSSLPPGLSLSAAGSLATISGTPATEGTYTFSLDVSDGDVRREASLEIVVTDAFHFVTTVLPAATTRVAYSAQIEAMDGPLPYAFAIDSGRVPSGFTLSADGVLSGVATGIGTYTFTVRATDGAGSVRTQLFSLRIGTLELMTATLPPVTPGSYSAVIAAAGGVEPYTWAVTAGALPPGWTFAGASSEATIAGDAFYGSATFTITVTDAAGNSDVRVYTVSGLVAADPERALWPVPPLDRSPAEFAIYTATVTDLITGLDWTSVALPAATRADAAAQCASLSYGGHGDWRLPAEIELISILDEAGLEWFAEPFTQPFLTLWTRSGSFGFSFGSSTGMFCVRADPIPDRPRYVVTRGASHDTFTGLMWSPEHWNTELAWFDENFFGAGSCARSGASGFTDWRVPELKELYSAHGPGTIGAHGTATIESIGTPNHQYCVRDPESGCTAPVADLSATPLTVPVGTIFNLDASSSTVTGSCAAHYTWSIASSYATWTFAQDFTTGPTVAMIAGVPGTYPVTLRVTVDGAQSVATRDVIVTEDPACTLATTVDGIGSLNVTATGGTPPYSYLYVAPFAPRTDPDFYGRGRRFDFTGFIPESSHDVGCQTTDEGRAYHVITVDAAGCADIQVHTWDCGA